MKKWLFNWDGHVCELRAGEDSTQFKIVRLNLSICVIGDHLGY